MLEVDQTLTFDHQRFHRYVYNINVYIIIVIIVIVLSYTIGNSDPSLNIKILQCQTLEKEIQHSISFHLSEHEQGLRSGNTLLSSLLANTTPIDNQRNLRSLKQIDR